MRIAVRLDDINPHMNYEKFWKVKEMLDRYEVCPLIGVVPDNQDIKIEAGKAIEGYNKMLLALKESGWIIAMHGVTHKYLKGGNNKSEFCGLDYEEQYRILKMGKEKLELQIQEKIKIFFAPANNHDDNTLLALKELGFTHISYGQNDNIFRENLVFIPIASGIRQVYRLLRLQSGRSGVTTLVIHPNAVSRKLLRRYDKLLEEGYKKKKLVNYGELLLEEVHEKNMKWIQNQEKINSLELLLSRIKRRSHT